MGGEIMPRRLAGAVALWALGRGRLLRCRLGGARDLPCRGLLRAGLRRATRALRRLAASKQRNDIHRATPRRMEITAPLLRDIS